MARSKLIAARENEGLSQKTLAGIIGISRNSYSHIETGKRNPSLATAKLIGAALGIKIDPTGLFDNKEEE